MHQGHNMQQVILTQLLQSICQLLHIDGLLAPALLLGRVFAADTVCIGGARVLEKGEKLGFGVAEGL